MLLLLAAVGIWATRQRCPSAASCPQPRCVSTDGSVAPDRHRRALAGRLMWTPGVVERKPGSDPGVSLAAVGVALQVLRNDSAPAPAGANRGCLLRSPV
jgi:hypothetical protein